VRAALRAGKYVAMSDEEACLICAVARWNVVGREYVRRQPELAILAYADDRIPVSIETDSLIDPAFLWPQCPLKCPIVFQSVVGITVSAIPEGLPALITITLAIGVQRMAQRHAIIRRLPAVETLGSVSRTSSSFQEYRAAS